MTDRAVRCAVIAGGRPRAGSDPVGAGRGAQAGMSTARSAVGGLRRRRAGTGVASGRAVAAGATASSARVAAAAASRGRRAESARAGGIAAHMTGLGVGAAGLRVGCGPGAARACGAGAAARCPAIAETPRIRLGHPGGDVAGAGGQPLGGHRVGSRSGSAITRHTGQTSPLRALPVARGRRSRGRAQPEPRPADHRAEHRRRDEPFRFLPRGPSPSRLLSVAVDARSTRRLELLSAVSMIIFSALRRNMPSMPIDSSTSSVYVTVVVPSPLSTRSYDPRCDFCVLDGADQLPLDPGQVLGVLVLSV